MFSDVRASIEAEQAKVIRGVGGKVRGWLRKIPSDVAAVIALRCTMTLILQATGRHQDASPATIQRIAVSIGRAWVSEIQVSQAASISPAYYDAALKSLSKANISSPAHVRKTLARVVKNVMDGQYDAELSDTDLLHLGKHGLQACMDAGLVELERTSNSRGHLVQYVIPANILAFLADSADMQRMATPMDCIMITPPILGGDHRRRVLDRAPPNQVPVPSDEAPRAAAHAADVPAAVQPRRDAPGVRLRELPPKHPVSHEPGRVPARSAGVGRGWWGAGHGDA